MIRSTRSIISVSVSIVAATILFFACVAPHDINKPINGFDENGYRNGIWEEPVDERLDRVRRSKASYIRYEYYHHGQSLSTFQNRNKQEKYKLEGTYGIKLDKRNPGDTLIVLDGTYFSLDPQGDTSIVQHYKKGLPCGRFFYHRHNDNLLIDMIDFDTPLRTSPYGCEVWQYSTGQGESTEHFVADIRNDTCAWFYEEDKIRGQKRQTFPVWRSQKKRWK